MLVYKEIIVESGDKVNKRFLIVGKCFANVGREEK